MKKDSVFVLIIIIIIIIIITIKSCLMYAEAYSDLIAKISFIRTEERSHVVCNCKLSLDSLKSLISVNICNDKMRRISSLSDELLQSLTGFCST